MQLQQIRTNLVSIGDKKESGMGLREKIKKKQEEAKDKITEKGKGLWEQIKSKGFEGIYGKETPSGQTYLGKDIPKREGGILGEGGIKDKIRSIWEDTDNKRRAGLENILFGKDSGFDLKTGVPRKKGGIFGREGSLENLLGKKYLGEYRNVLEKVEGTVFGKGGIAGFFGREGEGDWKTLSETFGSEGLGGRIFEGGKGIFDNIINSIDKGKGKIFSEGGLGKVFGKGGLGKVFSESGLGKVAGKAGKLGGRLAKAGTSLIKRYQE